jgi:hypothetical protein
MRFVAGFGSVLRDVPILKTAIFEEVIEEVIGGVFCRICKS